MKNEHKKASASRPPAPRNKRVKETHSRARARKKTSLADAYPWLAVEWHPARNGDLLPEDVAAKSSRKVWWQCIDCGYEWEAYINNRTTKNSGCPACAGRVARPGVNDVATLFPNLLDDWDCEGNEMRGIDPSKLMRSSKVEIDWVCHVCGHSWRSLLASRTVRDAGCPKCREMHLLEKNGSLATHYPDIAAEWDLEASGDLTPDKVAPFSNQSAAWICPECGYHYTAIIRNRTNGGTGCPECNRRKRSRKHITPLIETGAPMRVAVTYDESDGTVFSGLGRCSCLLVYDIENGAVKGKYKLSCAELQRDGTISLMKEEHITHFITGELGGHVMVSLRSSGIICRYNVSGSADRRVGDLLQGRLDGEDLGLGFERKG